MIHDFKSNQFSKFKSFFRTETVLSVGFHLPIECIGPCRGYKVSTNISYANHYQAPASKRYKIFAQDKTIWKFKKLLMEKVEYVLNITQFVP